MPSLIYREQGSKEQGAVDLKRTNVNHSCRFYRKISKVNMDPRSTVLKIFAKDLTIQDQEFFRKKHYMNSEIKLCTIFKQKN